MRASLVSGHTAWSVWIDQDMSDQAVAFVRAVRQIAVHRQRIADARAEGEHGETVQTNAGAEPARIHQQGIDIVVNAGRQARRLAHHLRNLNRPRPMQERREGDGRIVGDMPAK